MFIEVDVRAWGVSCSRWRCSLIWLLSWAAACSPPGAERASSARPAAQQTDAALRAAYISGVQAKASERYAFHAEAARSWADHPRQGFSALISEGQAAIIAPGDSGELRLRLARAGCAPQPQPVAAATLSTLRNRVELQRGGVTEWYVHGPLGLEQGFSLLRPFDCAASEELALELELSSSLQAEQIDQAATSEILFRDKAGHVVMRYGELFAYDAEHRALDVTWKLDGQKISIYVDPGDAKYPITIDPLVWLQQQKLIASDAATDDQFGYAVSISGDTAAVAAPKADLPGFTDTGAVYVYVRAGTTWTEQQKIVANDAAGFEEFGHAIALEGDTLAVAAWHAAIPGTADTGAVYVFKRAATTWALEQKLVASDAANRDLFGSGVALSKDTIIAGAMNADVGGLNNSGAAYVYTRVGTTWTQQAKIIAADRASNDLLGWAVALDNDTAVIGAPGVRQFTPGFRLDAGSVYVFTRSGTTWSQQAKLRPAMAETSDWYGSSVAVYGDHLIMATPYADNSMSDSGAALIFTRSGTTWTLARSLPALATPFGRYGQGVAISASQILIGQPQGTSPGGTNGNLEVLALSGGAWVNEDGVYGSDGNDSLSYGWSVAVSGTTGVIGAPAAKAGAVSSAGAAYVFIGAVPKTNGTACSVAHECASAFCVDGVCCDSACSGGLTSDCLACSKAKGAVTDGVCGAAVAGTVCNPVRDLCDVADVCDGTSTSCVAVKVKPAGTVCRPAAGDCDVEEVCNGMNIVCPADTLRPKTTMCRAIADTCDLQEYCTGSSPVCPPDVFRPSTGFCRLAVGPCDADEYCTGTGPSCPSDRLRPSTAVCRASAGPCDVAEYCSGTTTTCPSDALQPKGTECRPSAGACDLAEVCSGTTTGCPGDTKVAFGTVCRAAAGPCDLAEVCSGFANTCPTDSLRPAGAVCRAAVSDCDLSETCTGSDVSCASDEAHADGDACAAGTCQARQCRSEADLSLSASPGEVQVSGRKSARVTVSIDNAGKASATGLQVVFELPETATFQRAEGTAWACQALASSVICRRDSLEVGSGQTLSLEFLPPYLEAAFTVSARIESAVFDPKADNNQVRISFVNSSPATATGCQYLPGQAGSRGVGVWLALLLLGLLRRRLSARGGAAALRG